jgi:hypothetical protein
MNARRHWLVLLLASAFAGLAAHAQMGTITTIVGGGPNNLPALSANLNTVSGIARDANGNFYLASQGDNRVYKIDSTGTLTIFAGSIGGYSGDGGPATLANLNSPVSVAVDANGNVFIADTNNSVIRRVDAASHIITTVAGNIGGTNCASATDPLGDGCPATSATLSVPFGVFVDGSGNIFIGDTSHDVVREVPAATGIIQTVAGTGTTCASSTSPCGDGGPAVSAQLAGPIGVFVDGSGNLFIADSSNQKIREVVAATGFIQTVAGTGTPCSSSTSPCGDGGTAVSAQLNDPHGVFVDGTANIFIADSFDSRIRKVGAANRNIQTVAGTGTAGFAGDGGPATSAELDAPYTLLLDGSGNMFIADFGTSRIREVVAASGNIQTFAGNGFTTFSGDGFPASDAALHRPVAVAVDQNGNLYIADSGNDVVRKVDAATGIISTVAGNAALSCSYAGDGGPATSAQLCLPTGLFVDASGNLFIADTDNQVVREVVAATGVIRTVAGNNALGFGFSGDGGPATSAQLDTPYGVTADGSGNIFIADSMNGAIREVSAATANIQTIAGRAATVCGGATDSVGDGCPATSATLNFPSGIGVDRFGNLFIGESISAVVREVAAPTGIIQTVAGTPQTFGYSGDGGPATSARVSSPYGVIVDAAGNLFFTDCGSSISELACNDVIRAVAASTGTIQTVAGNGTFGFTGDGGPATSAELDTPGAIALDPSGNVLIPVSGSNRVRSVAGLATVIVASVPASLPFGSVPQFTTSGSMNVMLTNNGIFPLKFSSAPNVTGPSAADFAITASTCMVGTAVAPGGNCTVTLTFMPSTGGAENATLNFADNAMPAAQSVALSGTGIPPSVTITSIPSFGNQMVNTTSFAQIVTVSVAAGTGTLQLTSITITGANPGDFAIAATGTTCPLGAGMLAGGASCTVAVTFTPTAMGARSAMLSIAGTDLLPSSPQTVSLTGTGTQPVVSLPPNVAFGSVPLNTPSATQTVTLMNTGNGPLNFTSAPSITGPTDFAITGSTCAVATPVAANGGSCTVTLVFTPTGTAAENATLNFADNATPPMQSVPLSGTGVMVTGPPFTLTVMSTNGANGSTVSMLPGDTATFTLVIQPSPGFTGMITVACQEVTPIPATILTSSPTTINVTTSPSGPITITCMLRTNCNTLLVGPRRPWNSPPPFAPAPLAEISGLALLLAMLCRKIRPTRGGQGRTQLIPLGAAVLLVLLVMTWTACISNPPPAIPNAPTTPAGVYQIQVMATVNATGQTVTLLKPLTVHIL